MSAPRRPEGAAQLLRGPRGADDRSAQLTTAAVAALPRRGAHAAPSTAWWGVAGGACQRSGARGATRREAAPGAGQRRDVAATWHLHEHRRIVGDRLPSGPP